MKTYFRFLKVSTAWTICLAAATFAQASYAECDVIQDAPDRSPEGAIIVFGALVNDVILSCKKDPGLEEALAYAGGLERDAYALGAMLFRRSGRTIERGGTSDKSDARVENLIAVRQLASFPPYRETWKRSLTAQLEAELYRRIPVAVDVPTRRRTPGGQFSLAPGDVLFVPRRPTAVSVIGAVKNPGAIPFDPQRMQKDYIQAAGGKRWGANNENAFVYMPDGQRRPLRASAWNYEKRNVPPGSFIVIPFSDGSIER